MKQRYTALLLIPLFVPFGQAQTPFEYADQRTAYVHYDDVIPFGTGGWLTWGGACDDSGVNCGNAVVRYDGAGTLLSIVGVPVGSWSDLATMPDGGVLICGSSPMCDVIVNTSAAVRLDATGSILWTREFVLADLRHCAVATSGTIAMATEDTVLINTADGDSLRAWPSNTGTIAEMHWLNDSSLLVAGASAIAIMDPMGTTILSIANTQEIRDVTVVNDEVLLLLPGMIQSRSDQLLPIDSIDLSAWTSDAKGFTGDGTTNLVRSSTGMIQFELDQGVLNNFDFDAPEGYQVLGAAVQGATISTCGVGTYLGRTSGVVRTHLFDGASAEHDNNVGIFIASVDSTWTNSPWTNVYAFHQLCHVGVVNHGTTPVSELMIEYFGTSWICGPAGVVMDLTGLQLAPGDTAVFPFPELLTTYFTIPQNDSVEVEFCLVALSPDNIIDRDLSDNETCSVVQFVNTVGMDEEEMGAIRVGPNPISDRIDITFASPLRGALNAQLFDPTGRQLAEVAVPAGSSTFSWPVLVGQGGVYVLTLSGQDLFRSLKLVASDR